MVIPTLARDFKGELRVRAAFRLLRSTERAQRSWLRAAPW
jgi:plasmid stability protein